MQYDGCTISRCSVRDGWDVVHADNQGQAQRVRRKEESAAVVLVICDWNMNGVHIDNNFTGRTQDNTMYMSSALHFAIDGENSFLRHGGFIIADEGFACREHILRPYNKRTDDLERILFNFVFKSTRLLVENAIGAWKQKCPLLNTLVHKMEPKELAKTILASTVLYQLWDDEREGHERGHEDVHGQGEVYPIMVHREARREPARRGEAIPV